MPTDNRLREAVFRDRRIPAVVAAAIVAPLIAASIVIVVFVLQGGPSGATTRAWMPYPGTVSGGSLLQILEAFMGIGFPWIGAIAGLLGGACFCLLTMRRPRWQTEP